MARPGGLGRGLGALIPTGTVAEQAGRPRRHPDRGDPAEPATAARALRRGGARRARGLDPRGRHAAARARSRGRGRRLRADRGERRWRAARRIGLQTIPAMVRVADDAAMLQHAIVENIQREELNPLEEAAAYQQLIEDFSLTHDDVATRVGKSRATITNTLRLLQLPPSIQRCLKDGTIRMGHARALLGTPDRAFQEQLARRVVAEDLSVRAGRGGDSHSRGRADRQGRSRGRGAGSRRPAPPARTARARGAPRRLPRDPGQDHDGRPPRPGRRSTSRTSRTSSASTAP